MRVGEGRGSRRRILQEGGRYGYHPAAPGGYPCVSGLLGMFLVNGAMQRGTIRQQKYLELRAEVRITRNYPVDLQS